MIRPGTKEKYSRNTYTRDSTERRICHSGALTCWNLAAIKNTNLEQTLKHSDLKSENKRSIPIGHRHCARTTRRI